MKRRAVQVVVISSMIAYAVWALVLRYGTPREKALVTEAVIISPIPPIP